MTAYGPITSIRSMSPEAYDAMQERADILGQRIAHGDKLIEASKRAARIVDRVLPVLPMGVPNIEGLGGFYSRARRFGDRNALYAAILPRLNAKVSLERPCAALQGAWR